jgi:ABC-type antimicrobial peptide transport system permease subunit
MSSTAIIAIITTFIIGSFILSAISYTKQQALKKRKLMIKRLQQQADEALSSIPPLLKIDKDYDLILQLQTLAVNALSKTLNLNPEDKITQNNLNTQKIKLNEYTQLQRHDEITCWLTTDAELSSTQSQLSYIDKLLDLYRNNGGLSVTKHQELKHHLNALQQKLSINTYLYQADTHGEQNNITLYQHYIKRAIHVIKKTSIEASQKIQKIKELSERIQEVKRTGRANELVNLIKPSETIAIDGLEETSILE